MKKTRKAIKFFIFAALLMGAASALIYRVGHGTKMYSVKRRY